MIAGLALLAIAGVTSGCGTTPKGTVANRHPAPALQAVHIWVSTADRRQQLARQPDQVMHEAAPAPATIEVDPGQRYQTIVGFGAAMTDSSAWLLQTRLDAVQRAALLRDLFGPEPGLRISLIRLTIGASDFSRAHYTFDDMPNGEVDAPLAHFSIAPIRDSILPLLQRARRLNPSLRVIASPWSAPGWMKTNGSLIRGALAPEHYGAFADYLVKYVDAMQAHGVPIFALTLQNEPHFEPTTYPGMLLTPGARAQVIGQFLGPKLAKRRSPTLILEWDHNWDRPQEPLEVLDDPVAAPYVTGVAWHCYAGNIAVQSRVHLAHPDKDTYLTECSSGSWGPTPDSSLLAMTREEIIGSTRRWARGVLFWNFALDESSGPHLGGCRNCRGLVTIDSSTGRVTRNDDYYAVAHASRFVLQGAERVESTATDAGLANVAFRNAADGSLVLIAANSATDDRVLTVSCQGREFEFTMPAQSVATFVWGGAQAKR